MKRRSFALTLLIAALLVIPFASLADEGMWLPDSLGKLPIAELKRRGLQLNPDEIYNTAKPSLKDAVVIVGGGTGTFVSPEGLILTNHHVAFEAATAASTTERDYINNGFLAKARAEEIPAPNFTVQITLDFKDVTTQVMAAVNDTMSDADRTRAIAEKQQELAKAAMQGRESEGIRAQVVEMFEGVSHYLYTYQMLRDVRMVYVPPKAIGYFGGDPDNFEWPRHCGDFAYLRAYVAPDGKPAAFNQKNTPFKPQKFLALDATGVKEGDFTMVLGYPGTTYRLRESYSVDYHQRVRLPFFVNSLSEQIDLLTAAGQRDPALKIKYADEIFGLSNTVKNFAGTLKGLKRSDLVTKKRAEEEAFVKALEANPAMKAKYGAVLTGIAAAYRELNSFNQRENALTQTLNAGDLANLLEFAYRRALDKEKPAAERSRQFADPVAQQIAAQLPEAWKNRVHTVERQLLASAIARIGKLPAEQRSPFVDQLFKGWTGDDRKAAEVDYARRAVEETKFKDTAELVKLFNAPAAELRAAEDPALKLVVGVIDELAPLNARTVAFNNKITKLRPLYVRAMLEWKKGAAYPDANRTLRFTYGEVKGYRPRDAVSYDFMTTLTGVIEKDGEEPFNVPAKLKELHAAKDFGGYVDGRLKDVPVAFLSTTDITGGNSGSSILNGKGEIVGLVFDGNFEGLGGDYAFNAELGRTINVDIRYVLFVTEKFAGAGYLFNEMTIKRAKAMAAGR